VQRTATLRAIKDLLPEDDQDLQSAAPEHGQLPVVVLSDSPSISAQPLPTWEDPAVQFAITLVEGKWRVPILRQLQGGAVRVGELRRRLKPISKKVLNQHLRDMARDGLVIRTDQPGRVPQVEYSLARPLGYAVLNLIRAVSEWSDEHFNQITRDAARLSRDLSKLASKI
jgi:DNA-binding HxlR family transcriptional regulator